MEMAIASCSSVSGIRQVAGQNEGLQEALLDSVAPVKTLLSTITRLKLKQKKFTVDTAALPNEMDSLWASLLSLDSEFQLQHSDKVSKRSLSPALKEFMAHCCREHHYSFLDKEMWQE